LGYFHLRQKVTSVMKKRSTTYQHLQPAIFAFICFLFMIAATISYTNYKQGLWEKDIRGNLLNILMGKKSRLEKSLYSRIYYTRGVAAYVALKPDISNQEFYSLASEYIKNDTVIGTMALSKNCIINAIYPIKGHETAIGLNLLEHPERKDIVGKTIKTHQTFVAGPVELVEGGVAFISYTPIFEKQMVEKNKFWGVTDIVIKQKSLFREAQLMTPEGGYEFALRGYNGTGEEGSIFWGNPEIFENDPVTISIDLPIGHWIMAAVPTSGWNLYPDQDKVLLFILLLSSFIISFLIWLFTRALLKIKQNEQDLKAIFGSMDNLIVEYNSRGEYRKIAPNNKSILFRPEDELIGKTVREVFENDLATLILDSIRQCLRTKRLVVIDYPLEIHGKKRWFTARINYKNEDNVIFNAFDVTEKRKDEETIHQSEIRLKKLNEVKDKFFSVLAHDLRNPVGSQKMLTDLILSDYDSFDEAERKEILQSLQESSSGLYTLLEDLLEWARSQSEEIDIDHQTIRLNEFCRNLVTPFLANAHLKNIKIEVSVPENASIVSDPNIVGTILRNLISNAIKFTGKGGEVRISSEEITVGHQQFQKINIADNGIGIKPEILETLFQFGINKSSFGTDHEKGSGLGLSLCKDLAPKIEGELNVISEPGKGSIFSLTLPVDREQA